MRLCCKHPLWYFFTLKAHFRTFHRLWMKSKKCISLRETWQSVGGWSTGPEETRLSINDTAPQSLLCQDIIDKARKVCPKNVKTGGRHCPAITKRHSPTGKHSSGGGERRQICPGTWQKYVPWLMVEALPCPYKKTAILCGRAFEVSKTTIISKHAFFIPRIMYTS